MVELIEDKIFKGLDWNRKDFDKEKMLQKFAQNKQCGQGIFVSYELRKITEEVITGIKKAISRECEIRLLQCDVNNKVFLEKS